MNKFICHIVNLALLFSLTGNVLANDDHTNTALLLTSTLIQENSANITQFNQLLNAMHSKHLNQLKTTADSQKEKLNESNMLRYIAGTSLVLFGGCCLYVGIKEKIVQDAMIAAAKKTSLLFTPTFSTTGNEVLKAALCIGVPPILYGGK